MTLTKYFSKSMKRGTYLLTCRIARVGVVLAVAELLVS